MNKNKNFLYSLKLPAKILQVNVKILKLKPITIKMPKKFKGIGNHVISLYD